MAVKSRTYHPAQRLRRMHDVLMHAYGPQHWWPAKSPFEVILGAYLTQNTAWKAVERSLANLRAPERSRSKACAQFRSQSCASSSGPRDSSRARRPRSRRLSPWSTRSSAHRSKRSRRRRRSASRRLLELPGVGQETADAILLYALGHTVPVADEYLRRIAERHGLIAIEPARKRISYDALSDLTRRAFSADPAETRAALSTSSTRSPSPSARRTAAARRGATGARWLAI